MQLWLANKWDNLRTNFWFVPTIMVLGAIALSFVTINLDKIAPAQNWLATLGWTFSRGPEGSRAVLATVAGSMMTIASVTFSITIVALQLASSQFGPRLLRNFMRDRGNQVAMGIFIATFTYCLLVLRTVNGSEGQIFVPHISVTVGLFLALISLGVLIYFIHHSAESIQAENVIDAVSKELRQAIERLYPETLGQGPPQSSRGSEQDDLPENFDRDARAVPSPQSDYLQAIDLDKLLELAVELDLVIALDRRPGKFFFAGNDLARVWPNEKVDEELSKKIANAFYFGVRRSLTQDVEFAIDQLVEVAVRALSPGINDPFTAMNCLDRLGSALCTLTEKKIPSPFRYDEEGKLRVVTDASTVPGIVDAAFNQIRQNSRDCTSVTMRLLETITAIAHHTRDPAFLVSLRHHADAVYRGSQSGLDDPVDRDDAAQRYRVAINVINGTTEDHPVTADATPV